MKRVKWNGLPINDLPPTFPSDLQETVFNYLPPLVPMTPIIKEMAQVYQSCNWTNSPYDYAAMQAAFYIRPKSPDQHQKRRENFLKRSHEAEKAGFVIPETFRKFMETDAYIDRVHHNTIWLEMPSELCPLPSDPTRLVFLAFGEGQGCCFWHLLLAPDGTHCMVACENPFGLSQNWPRGVPDMSKWKVNHCANSIEEWLYSYFQDSAEHDRQYIERLRPYHSDGWSGA